MSVSLRIALLIFALFLVFVTTYILKKGRIPEKYSLLWYFISFIILLLAIFPSILTFISDKIGFQAVSSFIIGVLLVLLTFITMALTIIVSGQKKKTTLLIQEISLIKSEMHHDKKD